MSAEIDGALDARRAGRLRRHLDACADCRAEREAMRDAVCLIRGLRPVEPPPDLLQRVRARLDEEAAASGAAPQAAPSVFLRPAFQTALAATVLVGVGIYALVEFKSAQRVPALCEPAPEAAAPKTCAPADAAARVASPACGPLPSLNGGSAAGEPALDWLAPAPRYKAAAASADAPAPVAAPGTSAANEGRTAAPVKSAPAPAAKAADSRRSMLDGDEAREWGDQAAAGKLTAKKELAKTEAVRGAPFSQPAAGADRSDTAADKSRPAEGFAAPPKPAAPPPPAEPARIERNLEPQQRASAANAVRLSRARSDDGTARRQYAEEAEVEKKADAGPGAFRPSPAAAPQDGLAYSRAPMRKEAGRVAAGAPDAERVDVAIGGASVSERAAEGAFAASGAGRGGAAAALAAGALQTPATPEAGPAETAAASRLEIAIRAADPAAVERAVAAFLSRRASADLALKPDLQEREAKGLAASFPAAAAQATAALRDEGDRTPGGPLSFTVPLARVDELLAALGGVGRVITPIPPAIARRQADAAAKRAADPTGSAPGGLVTVRLRILPAPAE